MRAPATAEVERVVVTGSNIPTAEKTGPNPVDTYRRADLEMVHPQYNGLPGVTFRNRLVALSISTSLTAAMAPSSSTCAALLPKETLVLIDGKRVAHGSFDGAGFSTGVDINLIPFSMVDHVDILKDGASAIYRSDAIAGVVNFFLIHKFRGLEIGGTYGNTTWERPMTWASGRRGIRPARETIRPILWSLLISGSAPAVFSAPTAISLANRFFTPFGGFDERSGFFPGKVEGFRLLPRMFFGLGGPPAPGVNTPLPRLNAATSPFYIDPFAVNPNAYPGSRYPQFKSDPQPDRNEGTGVGGDSLLL